MKEKRNTATLARQRLFAGVPDEDVHLALAICQRYGLDPLLRHVVLIPGGKDRRHNVYITRDGLLHVAHTSGKAWSLEVEEPKRMENPYTGKPDIYLRGRVRVYDPDTGREQVFEGGVWFSEYAQKGGSWNSHPAAMHQKVLEVFLLRRAFDVAVTPVEEMGVDHVESASMPVSPRLPKPSEASRLLEQLGLAHDRETARRLASLVVGREVQGYADLGPDEAEAFLARLRALVKEMEEADIPITDRADIVRGYVDAGEVPEAEEVEDAG
ncbi:hypothetical protein phiMa_08 [Thermus phage phiMa]|nr:hypothetical protein phiMa_08 [Thermus phage phiMa]